MKFPFSPARRLAIPCTVVGLCWSAFAQAADTPAFLGRITNFDYGKDQKLEFEISSYIRDHKFEEATLRAFAEAVKAATLTAKTDDAATLACTTLAQVGNDADVSFLATQLARPPIFPAALNALQQVGTPEATKALQDFAAGKATPDQAADVLLSLGRISAEGTVPFLAQKTSDANVLIRRAAFGALARIATPEALAVLEKAAPKADDGSATALTSLARTLSARGDKASAARLLEKILAADTLPQSFRVAAMRMMLADDLPGAKDLLAKLASTPDPATQPLVLAHFSRLSADQQKALVDGVIRSQDSREAVQTLQAIGKAFPVNSLLELIFSKNEAMQRAALRLLSRSATKAEFDRLLADYFALPAGDSKEPALRNALIALPAAANDWLSEALAKSTSAPQQAQLIQLCRERLVRSAGATLVTLSESPDPAVKKAALEALAALGAPKEASRLLDLLLTAKDPATRRDLTKALAVSLRQSPDKSAIIARATSQLATVQEPAVKDTLIDLMGKSGEPECLPVLFAEFQKADKARRTVILRAITNWPDDAPLDQLAVIAASDPEAASRIFALRASLDILGRAQGISPETKLSRLWQAFLLAQRPEEHKTIISQAATVPLPAARMLLGAYRFDPAVKAELAAANKAHEALLVGGAKKAPADEEDTAPKDEDTASSKKTQYPDNPFDTPYVFDSWEDPLGLAGRWSDGATVLDLVQYPQQTFQALLTTGKDAAPRKVLGLIAPDKSLRLYGPGVTGTLSPDNAEIVVDGAKVSLKHAPVGKTGTPAKPAAAKVLFDGKNLDAFRQAKWQINPDGSVEIKPKSGGLVSKETFGDARVYLEFRMPFNPESLGPRRGNSGVYLMNTYEVQLQDGFGTELTSTGAEPADRFCGSIYGIHAPKLNACAPPLEWQSLLIEFRAPKFDAAGQKTASARMSVWQNGELIQDNVEVTRPTGGDAAAASKSKPETKEPGPFLLQDHGNRVQFRNIWIEPLS